MKAATAIQNVSVPKTRARALTLVAMNVSAIYATPIAIVHVVVKKTNVPGIKSVVPNVNVVPVHMNLFQMERRV